MKKSIYFLLLTSLLLSCKKLEDCFHKPDIKPKPLPEFNKVYGGTTDDGAYSIAKSLDSGYIIAGFTNSINGDVSGNHGDYDAWIVKLDKSGNKQWQKPLGGSGYDVASSIIASLDGSYVIAGGTYSFDGDASGNKGLVGAWVVKLDGNGKIIWQKVLGDSGFDFANSITTTLDGGYIVTGGTNSIDEDVDAWIVKLDKDGNKLWQKILGGSEFDNAYAIASTLDSGFIMAGATESKDGDFISNNGQSDVWVVKVDKTGSIVWQKTLGGSGNDVAHSIIARQQGDYIIAGATNSNNGDVNTNKGNFDAWVIQLDGVGDINWQKTLGGSQYDNALFITANKNGDYIMSGYTDSKDGDIICNHGKSDAWIVKLNKTGNIIWQKTLGGSELDAAHFIITRTDESYLIAGKTLSNDGDVSNNHGDNDVWAITIKDE